MDKDFLETLRERAKKSKVYRPYQLTGLELSEILEDEKHKALYIKLAKEHGAEKLIMLAKGVAERKNIQNKGAYFMRLLSDQKNGARPYLYKQERKRKSLPETKNKRS
ncbi:MAG: hypothetical protein AAB903_01605 [Patescibacteria group bacterium]